MSLNPIWNFFEKLECDKSRALCKECGNTYSLGSDKPKRQSVTGLKCHLKMHKDTHKLYLKRVADRQVEKSAKKVKQEYAEMEMDCPGMFELPDFVESAMQPITYRNQLPLSPDDDVQNGDLTGSNLIVCVLLLLRYIF